MHFAKGAPKAKSLRYEISISKVFGTGGHGPKKNGPAGKTASAYLTDCINFWDGIDKSCRVWYYKATHIVDLYTNRRKGGGAGIGDGACAYAMRRGRKEEAL